MKTGFAVVILFLSVVVASTGCNRHRDVSNKLKMAENLMETRHDSALMILADIQPSSISDAYSKALYGMLMSQSLDKNHLDLTGDTLIDKSVEYFEAERDIPRSIVANYYKGRTEYSKGQLSKALISFFKVKNLAESRSDYFWISMACRGISDIYCDMYNSSSEVYFAKKENENMAKCGRQPYLNYSLNDYGRALYNNGEYSEAMRIAKQLADSARLYGDEYLALEAQRIETSCIAKTNRLDMAYSMAAQICRNQFAESQDSLLLGYLLMQKGYFDEASYIVGNCSQVDSLLQYNIKYNKYKSLGRYEDANLMLEYVDSVTETLLRTSLCNGFTGLMTEYFEMNRKFDEERINSYRVRMWLIVLLFIITIFIIVSVSLNIRIRYKLKIEEKVNYASQLQQTLMESKNKEDQKNSAIIKKLLADKYEIIERLSEIVIHNNDTKIARKKIADCVTDLIEQLSIRSEVIDSLEKEVDILYDNLFSDFRKDFPNLKDVDYRLFLFSILNFSNITISLFLKEDKVDAVYGRRRRLKNRINMLDEDRSKRYLKYL